MLDGEKCLVLELTGNCVDLRKTLAQCVALVNGLPPAARRTWSGAPRRVFDIGLQAGMKPHETHWTIPLDLIAALAKVGGEVGLTVYGAEWRIRELVEP